MEQLAKALQKTSQNAESDSFEGIRAITKAYVEFALFHPEISRLMFSMKERGTKSVLQSASSSAAVPIFRIVEAAHSRDRLRNNDVVQAVRIIWATIHGLAMLLMDGQIPSIT